MFGKVLMPVDGSECSLKAARVAGELARRFDSKVTLAHAVYLPAGCVAAGSAGATVAYESIIAALEETARGILAMGREALGLPDAQVVPQVLRGHPAEAILDEAREGRYDLIVIGSRGLSEFRAFLIGSVSDRVNHHAPCSVLIVR